MDQPAQIVTQTPPAGGPPLASPPIQPPVFPKKASKIPLILVVVLIITVVGIGAFWLGRSLSEPKISVVPTPTVVPETQGFSCQTDSDCVLVRNIKQCCSCPQAVNKEELEKNKDLLKFPHLTLEMIPTPPGGCKDKICSPCPEWSKAICVSGICKEAAEDQVVVNETPAPTSSPDLTAGWKTYTNTKYGFSLKYPSDWSEKIIEENQSLNLLLIAENKKVQMWVSKVDMGAHGMEGATKIKSETYLLDGKEAKKDTWEIGNNEMYQGTGILNNGLVYSLEFTYLKNEQIDSEKTFSQILSAFKFLSLEPSAQPVFGETYSYQIKTGGSHELKYPSGWSYIEASGAGGESSVIFYKGIEFNNNLPNVSLNRIPNTQKLTLDQWLLEKKIIFSASEGREVIIGGIKGKELSENTDGYVPKYYLAYGNYIFLFRRSIGKNIEEEKEIVSAFNQITGTFNFLN